MRKDKKLAVRKETLRHFGADLLSEIQGARFVAKDDATLGASCPTVCNCGASQVASCACPSGGIVDAS